MSRLPRTARPGPAIADHLLRLRQGLIGHLSFPHPRVSNGTPEIGLTVDNECLPGQGLADLPGRLARIWYAHLSCACQIRTDKGCRLPDNMPVATANSLQHFG
ncbi:hypothetical protein SAMN05880593_107260 [Rhizobium sp. RU36D]|nr:hypothetical protein SAMN05880593_107260 [Rhizobium sp. RU36D]